ncbi:hypothetical protein L3X38_036207 [Prunus dulcis]|uniref:Uncharacterized protein n=1 Tax=Prunus dulcis TaxID=3755 RepID=A0AAD4V0T0_PRUDU|nr:hypothetical protein L3X38_036207 [Prunus dulcis]
MGLAYGFWDWFRNCPLLKFRLLPSLKFLFWTVDAGLVVPPGCCCSFPLSPEPLEAPAVYSEASVVFLRKVGWRFSFSNSSAFIAMLTASCTVHKFCIPIFSWMEIFSPLLYLATF